MNILFCCFVYIYILDILEISFWLSFYLAVDDKGLIKNFHATVRKCFKEIISRATRPIGESSDKEARCFSFDRS